MTQASENTRCIIFMVISMAGFAIEDAIIKQLSFDMPISQILILTGGAGALLFGCIAKARGVALFSPALINRKFVVRNMGELTAAIFLVSAIVYGSLSSASAILQHVVLNDNNNNNNDNNTGNNSQRLPSAADTSVDHSQRMIANALLRLKVLFVFVF